jgi:hypothetical protein
VEWNYQVKKNCSGEHMPNIWDNPPDPERRRAQRSASSNSGIERADLWGDTDLPAEENELHVLDLLKKLETETDNGPAPLFERRAQQPTKWAQWDPELTCNACHYLNAADQRFCGHCGSPLQARDLPRPDIASLNEPPPAKPSQPVRPPASAPFPEPEPTERPQPEFAEPKPVARPQSAFSSLMAEPREDSRERGETELEFLRYKTQGSSETSNTWKIPVAVVILAAAGFVGYRLYNGWSILPGLSTSASTATPSVPPTTEEPSQPAASDVANPPAAAAPTASKPDTSVRKSKTAVPLRPETAGAVTPATQRSRDSVTLAPNTAENGPLGGAAELAQAQRYLSPASRDSAEAAKWLWKSVSKENPKAVLLLSDLYAKGDGVPKSCDQARLLLTVAARKGQTEAARRLQSFDAGGCQ